jgi:hypothetical protein
MQHVLPDTKLRAELLAKDRALCIVKQCTSSELDEG